MKNLFLFVSLSIAIGVSGNAHADTKLLIEYDGDAHTVVKMFTVPSRGVSRPEVRQKSGPLTQLPDSHVRFSWESLKGVSSTLMEDPRVIRAPMTPDGKGHEAILIQDQGVYLLTIKDDDIDLDTLKLTFPGAQTSTKIKVSPAAE